MELRASGEDYLEAIWVLQKKNGAVRSIDVVRHLDRSKPSVSRAIHLLQAGGFLEVDGRLLCLTDSGRAFGQYLLYRHDLLHQFLCFLNHSQNELEQVEKIEHFVDEKTVRSIQAFLGGLTQESRA